MAFHGEVPRPTNDSLVAAVREAGTWMGACKQLGVDQSTARAWRRKDELLESRVQEALFLHRKDKAEGKKFEAPKPEMNAPQKSPEAARASDEVSEVEILRERIRDLQAANKTFKAQSVTDAKLLEDYRAAFTKAAPTYNPLVIPKSHRASEQHEHVLLFSDAHAGEVVTLEQTLGINEYNWDVMLRRMGRIQDAVFSFQENRPYPISKLHVWSLGDGISGDIHDELSQTNDRTKEECVVDFSLDFAEFLSGFGPHYDEIAVAGVMGNHPRNTKKPQAKNAANNSDWTLHKFVEVRLANDPKFTFNFPRARYTDVVVAERWRALLLHGDGVRSTMVDVPWGGIIRFLGKLRAQFASAGKPLDIFALGHYHTANALEAGGPGVRTIMNSSLKGVDEYGLQRFGGGAPPRQVLLTVHPRYGITDVSYLDAEDAVPAVEAARRAAA
jgi:hypothetical protein